MEYAVKVDNTFIYKLARNSAYKWMNSISPLRSFRQSQRSSCCRQSKVRSDSIPDEIYTEISRNPSFRQELEKLKQEMRADRLIVSVGIARFTL